MGLRGGMGWGFCFSQLFGDKRAECVATVIAPRVLYQMIGRRITSFVSVCNTFETFFLLAVQERHISLSPFCDVPLKV